MQYDGSFAMKSLLLTTCLLLCVLGQPSRAIEPEPDVFVHESTESYREQQIAGFTVRVSSAAMAHPEITRPALDLLEKKLNEVIELTPAHTHRVLRSVVIWIEHDAPEHPCACYHPGREWLIENGFNPDKEKGIEIASPRNYVEWTNRDQPMMVLHELAHAYHDLAIGYDNQLIKDCYKRARASGDYDEVQHVSGDSRRHYAMTNEQEYFAELTESYFGKNDFEPFTREELREFDPAGLAMIEKLWLSPIKEE